jgi:hypothetical protein
MFISMSAFAQTKPGTSNSQMATVWVKIPNYAVLAITKKGNTVTSKNPTMSALIKNYSIFSVERTATASRMPRMNKLYEIKCYGDPYQLKEALGKEPTLFQGPEVMEVPTPLFTPNDYAVAVPSDYALDLINAKGAWDFTKGDSSVIIAILDENYHTNHEEIIGKYTELAPNTNPNKTHGTQVAITASGNTNNNTGKSSIGYKCRMQLRPNNYSEILNATYSGAKIINLSWSSNCVFNQYQQEIINEAYANGSVIIASAGNAGTCGGQNNPCYPAAYEHVISVTSIGPSDNHDRVPGNSSTSHNHHTSVDLCAPGYGVAVSGAPGSYTTADGTSYATPLVSGLVGLMFSVNKCLTPDQVETILKETAVNIYPNNPAYAGKLGAGRIDAKAAVEMAASFVTRPAVTAQKTVDCVTGKQGLKIQTGSLTGPFQARWEHGASGLEINNLNPGTYSAFVTDGSGCIAKLNPVTLTTVQPLSLSAQVNAVKCNGMNNGNINTTVTGGGSGYSYVWSNGSSIADPQNLAPGNYTVTVKDSKDCETTATYQITQPEVLNATIAKNEGPSRITGSIDLTVTGGNTPYAYKWNSGAITQDLANLKKGFYEVQVTDAKGCKVTANTTISTLKATGTVKQNGKQ